MSDILIKNMKMPENCVGCPLAKNYGMCAITKKQFNWGNPNRLSDCPLIEILPHGRLIDADAFIKEECNSCDGYCEEMLCDCLNCKVNCRCDFIKDIADAPTIIEAEGRT